MIKKLLLSLLAIFGFAFLISQNSYAAVDDVTYTVTNSNSSISHDLCTSSCSDYSYIILTNFVGTINSSSNYNQPSFGVDMDGRYTYYFQPTRLDYVYYHPKSSIMSSISKISFNSQFVNAGNLVGPWSFDIILSDHLPSSGITPSGTLNITENGTYDVTNYASASVNVAPDDSICDDPWIVRIFKDGFWGVMTAFVSLIVPILALFLIFRLVHDWLWGKG